MTEDDFDTLVDDATHAVNNLIPDRLLDALTADRRSDLLVQINDALTPILRDLAPAADEDERPQTRPSTVAAFVAELIETHMEKCEGAGPHPEDRPAHILSETFGTSADVESIATVGNEISAAICLLLNDGATFRLTFECVERV